MEPFQRRRRGGHELTFGLRTHCRAFHPYTERIASYELFGPPVAPLCDELVELWSQPVAAAHLLQTADHLHCLPVEDKRLQQLLKRTQKILSPQLAEAIRHQGLQRTPPEIQKKPAILLTRLLHMLQRNPNQDINSAPDMAPLQSVWLCVLCTVERILGSLHFRALRADAAIEAAHLRARRPDAAGHFRALRADPVHTDDGSREVAKDICRLQLQEAAGERPSLYPRCSLKFSYIEVLKKHNISTDPRIGTAIAYLAS